MNILMVTNTYKPIVGGLERSIEVFSEEYRSQGHRVLIVAPAFKDAPPEEDVFRVPAVQNFNGTDFSVEVPMPGVLKKVLERFKPDIVHSHHPFLAGDTALRIASYLGVPLVFTYHTMYELNTHYVPGNSEILKKFVIELAGGYSELCDRVIVPTGSIKDILIERKVSTKMEVVPTGIKVSEFGSGDGDSFRKNACIPLDAFLVGYLGRIEKEKNMAFLADEIFKFMKNDRDVHFLIAGDGQELGSLKKKAALEGLEKRVYFPGIIKGKEKIDAYHSMDIFSFASKSETQGLVLAEAMASGVPIIGLDAPGTRDMVEDGVTGFLIHRQQPGCFFEKLSFFIEMDPDRKEKMKREARGKAANLDYKKNAQRLLNVYEDVIRDSDISVKTDRKKLDSLRREIKVELKLLSNIVRSAGTAVKKEVVDAVEDE